MISTVFVFLLWSLCRDTIDFKSTNALYQMEMLHIAHVNVECKTLKTKTFIFTIVNKEVEEKKGGGVGEKICQINCKQQQQRLFCFFFL